MKSNLFLQNPVFASKRLAILATSQPRRVQTKYGFIFSLTLWFVAIIAPVTCVQAQSVDLSVDVGLLSGVQLGQSGNSTVIQRQSTALTFDINTVFDDDIIEWSLGLIMQLEAPIAAGAYPKIRVVKKRQADAIYAQLGIPVPLPFPTIRYGVGRWISTFDR